MQSAVRMQVNRIVAGAWRVLATIDLMKTLIVAAVIADLEA